MSVQNFVAEKKVRMNDFSKIVRLDRQKFCFLFNMFFFYFVLATSRQALLSKVLELLASSRFLLSRLKPLLASSPSVIDFLAGRLQEYLAFVRVSGLNAKWTLPWQVLISRWPFKISSANILHFTHILILLIRFLETFHIYSFRKWNTLFLELFYFYFIPVNYGFEVFI